MRPNPLAAKCHSQVTWALVAVGLGLRLWAYTAGTALWLDEILLSRNILDLPLRELLFQPLELDQVAPRGFLLAEKFAVSAFGGNEYALRLFPFLAGIAGLLLFRRLAERALQGWAVPVAVGLFALGVPLLKYGAEVKQYGLDATVAIILMLLALRLRDREASTWQLVLAGVAGFILIWFSQASVLVMGGIGVGVATEWLIARDARTWRMLTVTIPLWAVSSGIAVFVGMRSMTPATREFMQDFWRGGFFPLPLRSPADLLWFWNSATGIFSDPTLLRYRWPAVFLLLAVGGIVVLCRQRRMAALIIAGPVIIALVAAVAQQYPFRGRLLMFLVPGLLLGVAVGIEAIRRRAAVLHPAAGLGIVVILLVPPVTALAMSPPPYEIEHYRTILGHLQRHRRAGDIVYVFPLTRVGMAFYGPSFGLQPHDWITAACHREDTRLYIRDLDPFRGAPRVWVMGSGARPFRTARAAVQQYLETIGVKRDSVTAPSPTMGIVSIELYDLSDPVRLAAANSATFPVDPMPTDPRPGCRAWQRPDAPATLR